MAALLVILVILLALGILGTVLKGLLWLTLVAVILFVLAAAYTGWKIRGSRST